jgi:tRNA nucleotidyltransferase (CCA-adding enzyme)
MPNAFNKIYGEVLKQITPEIERRNQVLSLAKKLVKKVRAAVKDAEIDAEVRVEGSVAKDTWLSQEPDIDIFVRFPATITREQFGTSALKIAREATTGYRQLERFAEHPYLEAFVNDIRVNIVPCYKVEKGEWKSATDRTPYHTDYVKLLLNPKLRAEIRLLKQFMKGIGVYGAEIKVGGFSGYLCELLILNYKSFSDLLTAAGESKGRQVIDYEGFYRERGIDLDLLFKEPLVIIDPVDKGRNAASAVREECLDEFIAASRAFLTTPDKQFFFPAKTKPLTKERILNEMMERDSNLVVIKFGRVDTVPDVLWGQLYKSRRALRNLLSQNDFSIVRDAVWSNEKDMNIFIFELEHLSLPAIKRHFGPPLERSKECENFLKKHLNSPDTLSGPMINNGRWVVETKRKNLEADELLERELREGGKNSGIAEEILKTIRENFEILTDDVILNLYTSNSNFAEFLTNYYYGKPGWLRDHQTEKPKARATS